ncbi:MAG TPA: YggT family protein [Mycobacteriales bacterium]|nr:YggT family protein [Mycobacteriales bacterium]
MIAATIGVYVLAVFVGLLVIRFIMDWVMVLSRDYRPTGLVAAALELAYTATDPPIKALRRVIPPLRLGRASLDIAFLVVFIVATTLIKILSSYR